MNRTINHPRFIFAAGCILALLASVPASGVETIIYDSYDVTANSTGFGWEKGINAGIKEDGSATRLTGTVITQTKLRYRNTGLKDDPVYRINPDGNRARVDDDTHFGQFTLFTSGAAFDFASAIGSGDATPGNPLVYDVTIGMANGDDLLARQSFGITTTAPAVDPNTVGNNTWDFGVQIYRAATGDTVNTVGKLINSGSRGVTGDIREPIETTGVSMGSKINFLIRVTDAGSESGGNYNSRVQVSRNGGSTWIYDTADDKTHLPNGWRFDGATRYFSWDQAQNVKVCTYDDFLVKVYKSTWNGAGTGDNWATAANWTSGLAPDTAVGEQLTFAGSTRLTPNMEGDYSIQVLKFASGAGSFTISATAGKTLTLNGDILQNSANAQTLNTPMAIAATRTVDTATGNLTIGGAISGAGGIAKSGDYTLTLSGANTYSGNTTVSDGTLLINGSIGSGAVSVASGATLGGAGTIGGNVTVQSDATLAPGATIGSIGSLTISGSKNVTLASNSKTAVEINRAAPSSDLLAGIGTLTMGGTLEVANTGTALAAGDTFTLFSAGTYSGEFAALSPSAPDSNAHLSWDFPALKNTGVLAVHYAPIAPSAAKLITTSQNTPTAIYKAKLLAGASDADGHPLTVSAASSPSEQGGAVEVQADQVIYTPPTGFTGPDRFSYTISDGHGGTAVGTVNVTVTDIGGMSPNIVSGPTYANGVFSVTFAGIPNVNYTVEYTTAMPPSSGWIKLNNVTAAGNGLFVVEDIIGQAPSRFYRTVHPAYE